MLDVLGGRVVLLVLRPRLGFHQSGVHCLVTRRNVSTTLVTYGMGLLCACNRVIGNCLCLPLRSPTLLFMGHPGGVIKRFMFPVHGPRRVISLLGRGNVPMTSGVVLRNKRLPCTSCVHLTSLFPRSRIISKATVVHRTHDMGAPLRVRLFHQSTTLRTQTCDGVPSMCRPKVASHRLSIRIRHLVQLRNYLKVFEMFNRDVRVFVKDILTKSGTTAPSPCSFTLNNGKLSPSLPKKVGKALLGRKCDMVISVKKGFCKCVYSVDHIFSVKGLGSRTCTTRRIYLRIRSGITSVATPNIIYRSLCGTTVRVIAGTKFTSHFVKISRRTHFVKRNVKLRVGRTPILTPHVQERLRRKVIFTLRPGVMLPKMKPINVRGS